jgi:hypothetical protein
VPDDQPAHRRADNLGDILANLARDLGHGGVASRLARIGSISTRALQVIGAVAPGRRRKCPSSRAWLARNSASTSSSVMDIRLGWWGAGALCKYLETLVSRGKRWYTLDQREQKFRMALGAGMGRASPLFTPVDEERT